MSGLVIAGVAAVVVVVVIVVAMLLLSGGRNDVTSGADPTLREVGPDTRGYPASASDPIEREVLRLMARADKQGWVTVTARSADGKRSFWAQIAHGGDERNPNRLVLNIGPDQGDEVSNQRLIEVFATPETFDSGVSYMAYLPMDARESAKIVRRVLEEVFGLPVGLAMEAELE